MKPPFRFGGMLKGRDIVLTPLIADDSPTMFAWINDRQDVLFNAPYRPVSEPEHAAWFHAVQQRADTVIFAIRLTKKGTLVGSCQLHSISPVHRTAELQIRLGEPTARRQGYGTEAARLLLDFAFNDLGLGRVSLRVFASNEAALRTYEKVGFVREGVLRKAAYIDGHHEDVVIMGILREEHGGRR